VRPTPRAVALADAVQDALDALESALGRTSVFDPSTSRHLFRIHMSDIGEGRFLPELMGWLHAQAPGVRVGTLPVPHAVLAESLGRRLIRLQCYEGLDVASAVYEWNYARQMIEQPSERKA